MPSAASPIRAARADPRAQPGHADDDLPAGGQHPVLQPCRLAHDRVAAPGQAGLPAGDRRRRHPARRDQPPAARCGSAASPCCSRIATRLVPGLVDMAIQRLGSAGQRTDDAEAVRLREPTLFAPSPRASGPHGPFGAESRGFSVQMWLNRRPRHGRPRPARRRGPGRRLAILTPRARQLRSTGRRWPPRPGAPEPQVQSARVRRHRPPILEVAAGYPGQVVGQRDMQRRVGALLLGAQPRRHQPP